MDGFIVFKDIYLVKQSVEVCHAVHVEQDAASGVFGERAAVYPDAGSVGYVDEFGEELFELGRPCALDGVRAFWDEVVGVLKRRNSGGFFAVKEPEGKVAGDGFAGGLITYERELYH